MLFRGAVSEVAPLRRAFPSTPPGYPEPCIAQCCIRQPRRSLASRACEVLESEALGTYQLGSWLFDRHRITGYPSRVVHAFADTVCLNEAVEVKAPPCALLHVRGAFWLPRLTCKTVRAVVGGGRATAAVRAHGALLASFWVEQFREGWLALKVAVDSTPIAVPPDKLAARVALRVFVCRAGLQFPHAETLRADHTPRIFKRCAVHFVLQSNCARFVGMRQTRVTRSFVEVSLLACLGTLRLCANCLGEAQT